MLHSNNKNAKIQKKNKDFGRFSHTQQQFFFIGLLLTEINGWPTVISRLLANRPFYYSKWELIKIVENPFVEIRKMQYENVRKKGDGNVENDYDDDDVDDSRNERTIGHMKKAHTVKKLIYFSRFFCSVAWIIANSLKWFHKPKFSRFWLWLSLSAVFALCASYTCII